MSTIPGTRAASPSGVVRMGMIALAGATIVSLIAYDMADGYELSEIREFLIACVFLAYGLWLLRRQAEAGSVAATQAG